MITLNPATMLGKDLYCEYFVCPDDENKYIKVSMATIKKQTMRKAITIF